jgi:glutamate-1-semialdehyde 2,1-aminomutase
VRAIAATLGLEGFFDVVGRPCNLVYVTRDQEKRPSQGYRTLFLQELLRRGVLAPSFVVTAAHTDADIDATIDRVAGALTVYKHALDDGLAAHLRGRAVKPVFREYN